MTPRLAMLVLLPLLAAGPALSSSAVDADGFPDPQIAQRLQHAQELARQAGEELMRSLQSLEASIPRYGMPFVDERGNIVIPRRHPKLPRGTVVPDPDPGPV
ncbi:MAG TPA: hypothetical protein VN802_21880 [Stellaceae bacterium]|nr:hypothetical protein [Stellaceae bacterium]